MLQARGKFTGIDINYPLPIVATVINLIAAGALLPVLVIIVLPLIAMGVTGDNGNREIFGHYPRIIAVGVDNLVLDGDITGLANSAGDCKLQGKYGILGFGAIIESMMIVDFTKYVHLASVTCDGSDDVLVGECDVTPIKLKTIDITQSQIHTDSCAGFCIVADAFCKSHGQHSRHHDQNEQSGQNLI